MKRDAKKDLRLCARVTLLAHKLGSKEINPSEITEHWINRAVVAEARVEELENGIRDHKDAWRISKAFREHDTELYKLLEKQEVTD